MSSPSNTRFGRPESALLYHARHATARNSASTIILGGHNIYGEDGGILNVAATTRDGLLWIANPNGCKFMWVFRILTHLPASDAGRESLIELPAVSSVSQKKTAHPSCFSPTELDLCRVCAIDPPNSPFTGA